MESPAQQLTISICARLKIHMFTYIHTYMCIHILMTTVRRRMATSVKFLTTTTTTQSVAITIRLIAILAVLST